MKTTKRIESMIFTVRGQRVMLDSDIAELYGVLTKRLNEQVKRNADRFPEDFCFQLTASEWKALRSQIAILNTEVSENTADRELRSQNATFKTKMARNKDGRALRSQNVTLKQSSNRKYLPYVFTEHGAIMAANVLNSPDAVTMSVYVVRAFVLMREQIAANAEILKRLAEIDKTLLKHDKSLQIIWSQLQPLLAPPPKLAKRRIGFNPDKK